MQVQWRFVVVVSIEWESTVVVTETTMHRMKPLPSLQILDVIRSKLFSGVALSREASKSTVSNHGHHHECSLFHGLKQKKGL
jgi:hypothetical protein